MVHLGYIHEGLFASHLAEVILLELGLGCLTALASGAAGVAVV